MSAHIYATHRYRRGHDQEWEVQCIRFLEPHPLPPKTITLDGATYSHTKQKGWRDHIGEPVLHPALYAALDLIMKLGGCDEEE